MDYLTVNLQNVFMCWDSEYGDTVLMFGYWFGGNQYTIGSWDSYLGQGPPGLTLQYPQAGSYSFYVEPEDSGNVGDECWPTESFSGTYNYYASPPTITGQPQSQTVLQGANVTFTVSASSRWPLSYQWYYNGTSINGARSPSYSISSVQKGNSGKYYCAVSNSGGTVNSSQAALNVQYPPVITTQPVNQTVPGNSKAALTVGVDANPSATYQWLFNGTNLTDGGRISGSQSNKLTLTDFQKGDAGSYSVVARNGYGVVTSPSSAIRAAVGA
jgi:hypothetical protein